MTETIVMFGRSGFSSPHILARRLALMVLQYPHLALLAKLPVSSLSTGEQILGSVVAFVVGESSRNGENSSMSTEDILKHFKGSELGQEIENLFDSEPPIDLNGRDAEDVFVEGMETLTRIARHKTLEYLRGLANVRNLSLDEVRLMRELLADA